ncbi:hypothetical protein [Sulfitobacter sp.]|uniref:hypothetical protein n=1 Tax=Sulfitobacter sp. TaxID=1903071 RepID=UPI0030015F03
MTIAECPVPHGAFLARYVGQGATYTDCFMIDLSRDVTLEDYLGAFYTSPLFRAERAVLTLLLRRWIKDSELSQMLSGGRDSFAAWNVEARSKDQILMRDFSGSTRSWFSAEVSTDGTRLSFGSAVMATEGVKLPFVARLAMPLHRIYAKALLRAAHRRLSRCTKH